MPRAGGGEPLSALDVYAAATRAGLLYRSEVEDDTFLFGYAEDCRPDNAVSLTMPVLRDPYDAMSIVHPIFEMNLPEGALLERLRLAFAKVIPDLDSLGILALVGTSQVGRLRYVAKGDVPKEIPEHDLDEILTYKGTRDLFKVLLDRYAAFSGISGVQPKVLLRAAERLSHRGATHIVKSFDAREFPELAANEFFCMRAAHHAGMPVANVRLSRNRAVLVVDRFDLLSDGSYLGVEDLCVLRGLRAHGRYEGSYEQVALRIRDFVSPAHQREAFEQFFMIVALSCAVENGDAHLKNFAVTYENPERAVKLAPAYDIVSTTMYSPADRLALTLGGTKEFPDRARLIAFGRQACGFRPLKCRELLDRICAGVERAIAEIRAYASDNPKFDATGKRLVSTFERGVTRVSS